MCHEYVYTSTSSIVPVSPLQNGMEIKVIADKQRGWNVPHFLETTRKCHGLCLWLWGSWQKIQIVKKKIWAELMNPPFQSWRLCFVLFGNSCLGINGYNKIAIGLKFVSVCNCKEVKLVLLLLFSLLYYFVLGKILLHKYRFCLD